MAKWGAWMIAALSIGAASPAAAAACTSSIVGQMKFEFVRGRPVVSGTVDGKPARFLLALGNPWNFINANAVARLSLKPVNEHGWDAYSGRKAIALQSTRAPFDLGGLRVGSAQFLIDPTNEGWDGLDGGLGDITFEGYEVEVDPTAGVVRLISTKNCKDASLAYWPGVISVAPFRSWAEGSTTEVAVNGRHLTARISTSAPTSFLALESLRTIGADRADLSAAEALPDGEPSWFLPVESFAIGEESIQSTRLRVSDINGDKPTETETGSRIEQPVIARWQMILGSDFFSSHRVLLSASQNRLYITYLGGGVFRRPAQTAGTRQ